MSKQIINTLSFWFGQWPYDESIANKQSKNWFQSSAENDREIKHRFEPLIKDLLQAPINTSSMPFDQSLATILLLDQFTRNIYRGTAAAFSGDAIALDLCQNLLRSNTLKDKPLAVSVFICMPLQHSEDETVQQQSVDTFSSLVELHGESARNFYDYALQHKAIIDQFGRYPHRNHALGRTSTDEETAYLSNDAQTFGQ